MEMFEDFTDYIEAERRYSPLTVHNYQRDMEKFAAWCCERASLPIEEFAPERIDSDDVRQWILHRMEHDKIKPASMNRELSSLKSYYRFLRKRGVVNNDIFKRISSLKTPHKLPTFVPETRMETVLENVREQSESQDLRQQRNALIVALCMKKQDDVAETLETLEDIWDEYQVYENDEIDHVDDSLRMRYAKIGDEDE